MDDQTADHLRLLADNDLQHTALLGALLGALRESGHLTPDSVAEVLAEANVLPSGRPAIVARAVRDRLELD